MDSQPNSEIRPGNWRSIPDYWDGNPADQFQPLKTEVLRHANSPLSDSRLFMAAAMHAIGHLPSDWCSSDRAETLIAISKFYWMDGNFRDSIVAASHAVAIAEQGSHRLLEARARNGLAIQLAQSFEYVASIKEMLKALEISRELGNSDLAAKIYMNLGCVYGQAGLNAESLPFIERSARHFEESGDRTMTCVALGNAVDTCLRVGHLERALHFVREEKKYLPEIAQTPQEKHWAAQRALTNCLLFIEVGHIEAAVEMARIAREVAATSGFKQAQIRAEICEATTAYLTGSVGRNAMERLINRTRREATHTYALALDAVRRAYEATGESDRALALHYELSSLEEMQKYEAIERTMGRSSDWEVLRPAKVAELQSTIRRKVDDLINAAITQSVRAGYDHSRIFRVSRLAELFAASEGWSQDRVRATAMASKLIDLGMMVTTSELLSKQRELSIGERKLVAEHTRFGAELLVNAKLALLEPCVPVVRFHHERWDGTGPSALTADAIPVEARLVALCDSFDALAHDRPWRAAFSIEAALRMIEEEAGTHFDPDLSARFVAWVQGELLQTENMETYLATEAMDNDYVRTRERIEQLIRTAT